MPHIRRSEVHPRLVRNRATLIAGVLVTFCLSAGQAWGSIAACATTPTGNNLATYAPTALGNGCSSIDVSFENLGLTGTGGSPAQTTANNNIYSTATAASGNSVGPVSAFFDASAANWVLSGGGTASTQGTISYVATAHTGGGFGAAPTSGGNWYFSGLVLNPTASITGGVGNMITVTMTFCLNATSTSVGVGGCTIGNEGMISATYDGTSPVTFSCVFGAGGCVSSFGNTINFGGGTQPTQIAISDAYTITKGSSANNTLTLTNFENQFIQAATAPEPSTFVLMSLGLLGAGLVRLRQKRS